MTIEKLADSLRIKAREAQIDIKEKELQINDLVINSPGEYEVSGVYIEAREKGIFSLDTEDINILYLGDNKDFPKEFISPDLALINSKELIPDLEAGQVIIISELKKAIIKNGLVQEIAK